MTIEQDTKMRNKYQRRVMQKNLSLTNVHLVHKILQKTISATNIKQYLRAQKMLETINVLNKQPIVRQIMHHLDIVKLRCTITP